MSTNGRQTFNSQCSIDYLFAFIASNCMAIVNRNNAVTTARKFNALSRSRFVSPSAHVSPSPSQSLEASSKKTIDWFG